MTRCSNRYQGLWLYCLFLFSHSSVLSSSLLVLVFFSKEQRKQTSYYRGTVKSFLVLTTLHTTTQLLGRFFLTLPRCRFSLQPSETPSSHFKTCGNFFCVFVAPPSLITLHSRYTFLLWEQ